jgi:hypothetical protein
MRSTVELVLRVRACAEIGATIVELVSVYVVGEQNARRARDNAVHSDKATLRTLFVADGVAGRCVVLPFVLADLLKVFIIYQREFALSERYFLHT